MKGLGSRSFVSKVRPSFKRDTLNPKLTETETKKERASGKKLGLKAGAFFSRALVLKVRRAFWGLGFRV